MAGLRTVPGTSEQIATNIQKRIATTMTPETQKTFELYDRLYSIPYVFPILRTFM